MSISSLVGGYNLSINQPPRWLYPRLFGAINRIIRRRATMARCLDSHGGMAVTTVAAYRRATGVGVVEGAALCRRDQLTLVAAGVPWETVKKVRWQSRWG